MFLSFARLWAFFFDRLSSPTRQTNPVMGTFGQGLIQFTATTSNGVDMHPADLRHPFGPPVSHLLRGQRHVPTSLLLIQTAEK